MRLRHMTIAVAAMCLPQYAPSPVAADNQNKSQPGSAATFTARESGARYGQAAGAALVCYGLKTTTLGAELRGRYQGDDLVDFDDQAGKIIAAWKATLTCKNAGGPNECKLSHVWSCQQALKEIGPNGTAAPGLVEPKE